MKDEMVRYTNCDGSSLEWKTESPSISRVCGVGGVFPSSSAYRGLKERCRIPQTGSGQSNERKQFQWMVSESAYSTVLKNLVKYRGMPYMDEK